jgi:phosphoglycolate phosphatase
VSRARLIVFDLDGTLVDSRRDLAESANALLASCGLPPQHEDAIGRMVGDGAAMLVARAFAAAGAPPPPDALDRFLTTYNGRLLQWTRPYPGIPETLHVLRSRATLAVLTNKPIEPTRRILDGLDLTPLFPADLVRGGDGPLGRKPDPAGLVSLLADAGQVPAATVLVGDSAVDWHTARAAGVACCLVRYGFGFPSVPLAELDVVDRIVDRAEDLLTL